jgi:hypothetical protein
LNNLQTEGQAWKSSAPGALATGPFGIKRSSIKKLQKGPGDSEQPSKSPVAKSYLLVV